MGETEVKNNLFRFAPKMNSNTCYITKSLIIHGNTFFTRLTKIWSIQCPYINIHCIFVKTKVLWWYGLMFY